MRYDIVISHKNCCDGKAAKWIARKHADLAPLARFIECDAGMPLTEISVRGKCVLMLDVVCTNISSLLEQAKWITIIDHHCTNKELLLALSADNLTLIYDNNRCATKIAWDEFVARADYPWWINVIDDRDRWVWEHKWSRELGRVIFANPVKIFTFEELSSWSRSKIMTVAKQGEVLCAADDKQIQRMVSAACECTLTHNNRTYRVCITSGYPGLFSEVGNILSRDSCEVAAMWKYELKTNEWRVSLRSCGDVDCGKIAVSLGGGGHFHAASFTINGSHGNLHTVFKF